MHAPGPGSADEDDIARRYAWPPTPGRPWVRAVMVSSLDGAVEAGGRSAGVTTPADRRVFLRLRRSADVVLVGAGTVRAEDYRGIRSRDGGTPPPIAVVTSSAALDPASRLFTETRTQPLVLTTAKAPRSRRDALTAAGGDVVVLDDLGAASLLGELARRGLWRVLCEGGPRLLGALLDDDAVDELCLTLSPVLVGGTAARIVVSEEPVVRPMQLAGVLDDDGTLLLRYVRASDASAITPPNG